MRGVFGEAQPLGAVLEERAAAFGKVKTPRIHFGEQRDESGSRLAFGGGAPRDFTQQLLVGQSIAGDGGGEHAFSSLVGSAQPWPGRKRAGSRTSPRF
jgi:hypothetical protein